MCGAVIGARGGYFEETRVWGVFSVVLHFFVECMFPHVLIRGFDAFSVNLQCQWS